MVLYLAGSRCTLAAPTTTTSSSFFLVVFLSFFFFFLVRLVHHPPSPHPNSPRRHMVRVIAETSGPPQGALLSPVHLFQTGPRGTLVLSRGPRWLGIGPSKRFRFQVDCFAARWAVGGGHPGSLYTPPN